MLTLPGRDHYAARARASVTPHVDHLNLIEVPGIPDRHMGRNRARAYAEGSGQYVACLDDDDYLLGPLDEAIAILDTRPEIVGVYYDDCRVNVEGKPIGPGYTAGSGPWAPYKQLITPPHHICVMRRSAVLEALPVLADFPVFDLRVLHALILRFGDLYHVPSVRYAWTQHPDQHHKQVRAWQDAHQRAVDFARPLIIDAHYRRARTYCPETRRNNVGDEPGGDSCLGADSL